MEDAEFSSGVWCEIRLSPEWDKTQWKWSNWGWFVVVD